MKSLTIGATACLPSSAAARNGGAHCWASQQWHPISGGILLVCVLLVGCQQKMADQPSFKPLDSSAVSTRDGSARLPVAGTVARGHLHTDWALFTGRTSPNPAASSLPNGASATATESVANSTATTQTLLNSELATYKDVVDEFPMSITEQTIEHGQQRYMIYCVVCHDPAGTGHGKIVERGYTRPPSYHIARLRDAPVGHIYRVITLGYGSMPSYAAQIPPRDRWAIVAYVRALQLSQHFPEAELPEEYSKQRSAGSPIPFAERSSP